MKSYRLILIGLIVSLVVLALLYAGAGCTLLEVHYHASTQPVTTQPSMKDAVRSLFK